MAGETEGMSKSAKKRAAQKARAAAAAEAPAEAAPPPQPEPKAKAKAKAEPAAPVPKAKAKAAAPEPQAKAAAPEPKAKAKAKAEAAAPAPAAKAKAESKPKAESKKAASKPASKSQAKPAVVEEEPPKKEEDELATAFFDDGTGGDWEVSTGMNKKQEKQRAKREMEEQMRKAAKAAGVNPTIPKGIIPGYDIIEPPVAQAKAKAGTTTTVVAAAPAAPAAPGEPEVPKDQKTISIDVGEKAVGIIIGPKGATMNLIKEKTDIKAMDFNGGTVTVTGSAKAVEAAEAAILELTQKGYCSLAFEDFQENYVMVHPSYFPELIGKKGAVIQALKKELHVEVKLPQDVPKDGTAPPKKTYKVTVAGNPKNVEQAKDVIHHIMMYYHHEITHPGEVHEEMEVEPWQYSFLIGTKGSQMRHTQNNFHVKVHIPRDTSLNPNVCIVGEPNDVARAKASMEKIIWNANSTLKGRDRQDQPDDGWGEEADEEDWMRPYLFKRR